MQCSNECWLLNKRQPLIDIGSCEAHVLINHRDIYRVLEVSRPSDGVYQNMNIRNYDVYFFEVLMLS